MPDRDPVKRAWEDINPGPMTESTGLLLRLAQLQSFQRYFDVATEAPARPGELSVLMLIELNPGIRQGTLANALCIKRAHMTKMIKAMEKDGLLMRRVPEGDRRSIELELTDEGRAYAAQHRPFFERQDHETLGALDEEEAVTLRHLLRKYIGLPESGQTSS